MIWEINHGSGVDSWPKRPLRRLVKTEAEWKKQLTDEQYHVTREAGTECAFTGAYWNTKDQGMYHCVCCGSPLFDSGTKFNSGTGWPSFTKPADGGGVVEHERHSIRDGADRGALRDVRRASGTRVRGRSGANGVALLHEFGGARFPSGGEKVKAVRYCEFLAGRFS